MKHNLVNVEEVDEEMEGILALFRDQKVEDLESIESAATSPTSPASTSTEIASKMAEDATIDNALPTAPDIDDEAFSAISGTSGLWEGVVTGSSVEVDKLAPISAPIIILPTLLVSWAEYQPTSTDELLTIPDIDEHSPIPISEAPNPPSTTLWLQPFLHEGAMAAHRIYQEEIVRRGFKGKDSKWSIITHAERFEDKPIDLKEEASRSDGIATFIPVNSVQEDDTNSSSSCDSSSTSTITSDDGHRSNPWSSAINCSWSQHMSITSPMVSLEAIWTHGSPSENKTMGGANLTEGELYCTENITTSVYSVGEDHRRSSNASSAIITDTGSLANSGNQADDHIHQGIITCSSSATPSYGHDLHGNSSPWSNKRSYSHIMSSSSAMIPEGLSPWPLPASSPSGNVRVRGENLNTARRSPRVYSRQSIPQGISSSYVQVMSISSCSIVSSGEPRATPPTPENFRSMRGANAPTPGKRIRWTLDICHGPVKMNPDDVNNVQVCNTSTPIQEAEDMRRRSIRGKGLEVYNRPVFNPSTIQAEISQGWIQQHHKSEVDTSVFQFSPQEEAFAHHNFVKKSVGYDDDPEQFTFPQWEHELAEVLGMPESQEDMVEILMGDLMGLGLGGAGAGAGELVFNNTEFFGVTPQSEAENLREEITIGTQPQLNLNRADSSQRRFYQ